MARKTTKTKTTTATRSKRTLADRLQKFDLTKLTALKQKAEETIYAIAAEGLRREQAHKALQDTSAVLTTTVTINPTSPVGVTGGTPYAGTGPGLLVTGNGRTQTTSP